MTIQPTFPMKLSSHLQTRRHLRAFTLVEMLVVAAIIGLIMAIAVPAIEPMMRGSKLTTAADDVRYRLAEARQTAIAESKPVEVRFLKYIDPTLPVGSPAYFRAFQIGRFELNQQQSAFEFTPLNKRETLPSGVVFSDNLDFSSLLRKDEVGGGSWRPPGADSQEMEYVSFTFRPDGSTNLPKRSGDIWFITVLTQRDAEGQNTAPNNFITLMLDPFTGGIRTFQP